MKWTRTGGVRPALAFLPVCLLVAPVPGLVGDGTAAMRDEAPSEMEARIWLDRGVEPVLQRGERVRIYFRSSHDAYVALFHIDTDGRVRLLFPSAPGAPDRVAGGRDYRLLLPGSSDWWVADDAGIGYFFLLTSPRPLDTSILGYSQYTGEWDLSRVSERVYSDPYVAMDEFVAALLPEWEYTDFALDFTSYHVGQSYAYPRFLCYDCHTAVAYRTWNPYRQACTSFRIVIYNDPYYYPVTRYRGNRVVYTRPPVSGQPQFEFKERASGESGSPVVRTRDVRTQDVRTWEGTPPRRSPGVPTGSGAGAPAPGRTLPEVIRGPASGAGAPLPRSVPTAGGGFPSRTPTSGGDRPVLERRRVPPVSPPGGSGRVRPTPTSTRPPAQSRPPARPTTGGGPPVRTPPPTRPPTGGGPPARPPRGGGGGGGV